MATYSYPPPTRDWSDPKNWVWVDNIMPEVNDNLIVDGKVFHQAVKSVLYYYLGQPWTKETKRVILSDLNKHLHELRRGGLIEPCEIVNIELHEDGVFKLALIQDGEFKATTIDFYQKPKKMSFMSSFIKMLNS